MVSLNLYRPAYNGLRRLLPGALLLLWAWGALVREVKGQAWLEVDEGAGHYDYIEKHDSTWIQWGTNWTTWGNAEVRVNTNGADVWYPSVYMHMNGSDRHLSTIQELSLHHFPTVNWVAGAALDYYLRLD